MATRDFWVIVLSKVQSDVDLQEGQIKGTLGAFVSNPGEQYSENGHRASLRAYGSTHTRGTRMQGQVLD